MHNEDAYYNLGPKVKDKLLRDAFAKLNEQYSGRSQKKSLISGQSMPEIYQQAMVAALGCEDPQLRRFFLDMVARIREGEEEKKAGLATLEALGLPTYKKVEVIVADFLSDPDPYFASLQTTTFFPSVVNLETGARYFKLNLSKRKVIRFVSDLVKTDHTVGNHMLRLSEFYKNDLSGNIRINPRDANTNEESIGAIELNIGKHTGLVYEGVGPVIKSTRTFNDTFKFLVSASDRLNRLLFKYLGIKNKAVEVDFTLIRNMLESGQRLTATDKKRLLCYQYLVEECLKVISCIREHTQKLNEDDDSFRTLYPGYYEFIINIDSVRTRLQNVRTINSSLTFIDYRDVAHYSNLQQSLLSTNEEISD